MKARSLAPSKWGGSNADRGDPLVITNNVDIRMACASVGIVWLAKEVCNSVGETWASIGPNRDCAMAMQGTAVELLAEEVVLLFP